MQIGFIGLGQMGLPMFANLARAYPGARAYDAATAQREHARARLGGHGVVETAGALSGSDVLVTMLPHGAAVRASLLDGADPLAGQLAPGALVIDMSSSSPLDTRDLAQALAGRGLALLDAPVSGSVAKATDGSLSIMVGGADADLARARPVLEAMGQRIIPTGAVGSAHAMKALNNYVYAAGLLAASEALHLARALDLHLPTLVDVLNASSGRNVATETKLAQHMLDGGDFRGGFGLHLMAKDLGIAQGLQPAAGFAPPQLALVHAVWQAAAQALPAGADNLEIHHFLRARSDAGAAT